MTKSSLFDDTPNEEAFKVQKFKVNKEFAKEYESRKQKEELQNAQAQGFEDELSSSEEESEDEDGDLLTPAVDVSILKAINAIRKKDESIYDPNKKFYDAEVVEGKKKKEKSLKKKRFKDVLREQILDQIEDEEGGANKSSRQKESQARLEYDEEQKELRSAFLDSTKDDEDHEGLSDDDENSKDDDMLIIKKKAEPILDDEDSEMKNEYLQLEQTRSKGTLKDPRGEVEDGEQFLIDFLKNKKWIEKEDEASNDENDAERNKSHATNYNDDDSIDEVDKADDFEAKYNFRYEEAANAISSGADYSMVGYARSGTMDTLRRKDDKRTQKRLERKERKAAERKAKEEQLRRLKNAKRQELESKMVEIKKVIGSTVDNDMDEDAMMKLLEGDFDPEKFEKIMQDTYNDDFYKKEDSQWKSDADVRESLLDDEDGKMLVGEDNEDKGLYDNEEEEGDQPYHEEGDDEYFNEDVSNDINDEGFQSADSGLEIKLKSKIQEELYKLDYEDIVAGMPTRFKYREVEANNYGLSTKEILFARDTTLKSFVSLKQMAPYRDKNVQKMSYKKRRRFREMLEQDLEEVANEEGEGEFEELATEEEKDESPVKKKRRRQKKSSKKELDGTKTEIALTRNGDRWEDASLHDQKSGESTEEIVEKSVHKSVDEGKKKRSRKKKGKKKEKTPIEPVAKDDSIVVDGSFDQKAKQSKEKSSRKENATKKQKRRRRTKIAGIPDSRLEAYGL
mmetsp:Transcript_27595/g.41758  ORF Transcript_27595/g.41758 Transcript_27595/m.41758 type:complete len:736 (-) Transcript_27595:415-2622(-)